MSRIDEELAEAAFREGSAEQASASLVYELRIKAFEAEHGVKVLGTSTRPRAVGDGFECDVSVFFLDDCGCFMERPLPAMSPCVRSAIREACRALAGSEEDFDGHFEFEGNEEGVSTTLLPAARERVIARVRPLLPPGLSTSISRVPEAVCVSLRRPLGRAPRLRIQRRRRRARAPSSSDDGPEPELPVLARCKPRWFTLSAFAGEAS
jgi:hypothetical protein